MSFLVLAAYFVHTPVGSNATRLSLLFAIPLVVALVEFRPWLVTLTIIVAVVVQLPFTIGTLRAAGSPPTRASYYVPLTNEIASRGPITGRIEIPEMIGHWDTYYVAKSYPLARGWLRQVDTELNGPTLYSAAPTAANYRTFLDANAVEYVAIPDARLSAFGRREAEAIRGFSYLQPVWSGAHWTLYAVERAHARRRRARDLDQLRRGRDHVHRARWVHPGRQPPVVPGADHHRWGRLHRTRRRHGSGPRERHQGLT